MRSPSLLVAGLLVLSNVLAIPAPARVQRDSIASRVSDNQASSGFVYAEDGKFKVNGKDFFFAGTTAYWLSQVCFFHPELYDTFQFRVIPGHW